jgi:hypothetical protein
VISAAATDEMAPMAVLAAPALAAVSNAWPVGVESVMSAAATEEAPPPDDIPVGIVLLLRVGHYGNRCWRSSANMTIKPKLFCSYFVGTSSYRRARNHLTVHINPVERKVHDICSS